VDSMATDYWELYWRSTTVCGNITMVMVACYYGDNCIAVVMVVS
jgi:hypothetical protein